MNSMTEDPYNYVQGDKINCRIKSLNSYGYSEFSTGLVYAVSVRTEPHQMAPPTRNPLTDNTQIVIDWVAL